MLTDCHSFTDIADSPIPHISSSVFSEEDKTTLELHFQRKQLERGRKLQLNWAAQESLDVYFCMFMLQNIMTMIVWNFSLSFIRFQWCSKFVKKEVIWLKKRSSIKKLLMY